MKKIIFFNISWMEYYQGIDNGDQMNKGGSFVKEKGYGHEMFNFKNVEGKVYGYVQQKGKFNLKRLGANKNSEKIEDVLIIFTATHEKGGTYIVGWYKNATLFRSLCDCKMDERKYKGEYFGYYAYTEYSNATLLNSDERFMFPNVPRAKQLKGGMGQANIWYADSEVGNKFKAELLEHINSYENDKKINKTKKRNVARQVDVEKRKIVEKIAIDVVTEKYKNRNFKVKSVESDNKGWDLEAEHNKIKLKIEVKGLSGNSIAVELTHNEYKNMKTYRESYRLCIVINCLKEPTLYIFSYSHEKDRWIDEDDQELELNEVISARCGVNK